MTEEEYAAVQAAQAVLQDSGTEAGRLMSALLSFGVAASHAMEILRAVVDAAQAAAGRDVGTLADQELRKGMH